MPRKPHRHDNPNRAIHNRTASPKRNVRRKTARVIYLQQLAKEKEIGPDPAYDHSRGRSEIAWLGERQRWQWLSSEYDKKVAAQ